MRGGRKRVARMYDRITMDDVVAFLARSHVTSTVRGTDATTEIPRQVKDYLTKLGFSLPEV